jgi:hypothetical protein
MKKIKPYNKERYVGISVDCLIVFGIYAIITRNEKCTFEKLVAECFTLFPVVFSLNRYPYWPDSHKLDRPYRTLRANGFIVGSPTSFFSLTKFGEKMAKDTEKSLRNNISRNSLPHRVNRDAEINLVTALKDSIIFRRFLKNKKGNQINEMEVRNLLHCTLETPPQDVKRNLEYARNLAKEFDEKQLLKFIDLCSQSINKK